MRGHGARTLAGFGLKDGGGDWDNPHRVTVEMLGQEGRLWPGEQLQEPACNESTGARGRVGKQQYQVCEGNKAGIVERRVRVEANIKRGQRRECIHTSCLECRMHLTADAETCPEAPDGVDKSQGGVKRSTGKKRSGKPETRLGTQTPHHRSRPRRTSHQPHPLQHQLQMRTNTQGRTELTSSRRGDKYTQCQF